MSTEHQNPVREGDVVAGKYRVERVLGRGGMGVVLAAMHLELEQRVALKFLLPEAAERVEDAARFGREARAAAQIRSEHVARVIDVGKLPDGTPYMVMEYLEGDDLQVLLRQHGPMPSVLAVGYLLQACEAIAEAHALGIVHRDLKPANLYLARRPPGASIVKVLDFGISKQALALGQDALTKTSAVMGSPRYMSPEQLRSSKSVDARADVWALGAVLYELLTAAYPFDGETMTELVAAILEDQPSPLSIVRPDIAPGLQPVIARCLEKKPAQRFANVAELAHALAPFGPPRCEISVERISQTLGFEPAMVGMSGAGLSQPMNPGGGGPNVVPAFTGDFRAAVPNNTHSQWSQSVVGVAPPRSRLRLFAIGGGILFGALVAAFAGVVLLTRPSGSDGPSGSAGAPAASSVAPLPTNEPPPAARSATTPATSASSIAPGAAKAIPPTVSSAGETGTERGPRPAPAASSPPTHPTKPRVTKPKTQNDDIF